MLVKFSEKLKFNPIIFKKLVLPLRKQNVVTPKKLIQFNYERLKFTPIIVVLPLRKQNVVNAKKLIQFNYERLKFTPIISVLPLRKQNVITKRN